MLQSDISPVEAMCKSVRFYMEIIELCKIIQVDLGLHDTDMAKLAEIQMCDMIRIYQGIGQKCGVHTWYMYGLTNENETHCKYADKSSEQ